MSPARSTGALTREQIVSASIRLMQLKGFTGLGMRDIAQHLKIKAPSLYHHFPSKEALARQALEQYRQVQQARLQQLSKRQTRGDRLQGYATLFAEMLGDDARLCLYLVMAQERAHIPAPCVEELQLFVKQNVEWLEQELQARSRAPKAGMLLTARATAELIFGAFEGFMMMSLHDKKPEAAFLVKAKNLLRLLAIVDHAKEQR